MIALVDLLNTSVDVITFGASNLPSMDDTFLEIRGLVKRFGPFTAVDRLSFSVSKGEVLGFLGPNGAGKSTTMKMIAGYLAPTAGGVSVCGHDVGAERRAAQASIGYLPEGAPAYADMTTRQFLKFIAEVRGFRGGAGKKAIDRAVDRTELLYVLDQQIETLSKGFKRRVGLAQAILHDPKVLIMDEPTDGLDPNQKHSVRELIKTMAPEKAIIISTHILEEVDTVCTRVMIIDRGRAVADGTPDEITSRSRFHNAVTVKVGLKDARFVREALDALEGVERIDAVESSEELKLTLFPKDRNALIIEEISALLTKTNWDVRALYAEPGRLDQVFRSLTTADTVEEELSHLPKETTPAEGEAEDASDDEEEASFE